MAKESLVVPEEQPRIQVVSSFSAGLWLWCNQIVDCDRGDSTVERSVVVVYRHDGDALPYAGYLRLSDYSHHVLINPNKFLVD